MIIYFLCLVTFNTVKTTLTVIFRKRYFQGQGYNIVCPKASGLRHGVQTGPQKWKDDSACRIDDRHLYQYRLEKVYLFISYMCVLSVVTLISI